MTREAVTFFASQFAASIIFMLALVGLIFISGQAFGQRCEKAGFSGVGLEECVKRLSNGEAVQ